MAELLTNLDPVYLRLFGAFVALVMGFGGGYMTCSIKIQNNNQSQVQIVGNNSSAFQSGGNLNINMR